MIIKRIANFTRILGQSQGYLGLPIRDEIINDKVAGDIPSMVSAWELTPAELQRLNEGKTIYLRVLGDVHPPVMMWVEE